MSERVPQHGKKAGRGEGQKEWHRPCVCPAARLYLCARGHFVLARTAGVPCCCCLLACTTACVAAAACWLVWCVGSHRGCALQLRQRCLVLACSMPEARGTSSRLAAPAWAAGRVVCGKPSGHLTPSTSCLHENSHYLGIAGHVQG